DPPHSPGGSRPGHAARGGLPAGGDHEPIRRRPGHVRQGGARAGRGRAPAAAGQGRRAVGRVLLLPPSPQGPRAPGRGCLLPPEGRVSPVGPALPRLAESLRGLKVLVVGDAMLDGYLSGTSGRLCPEAPVPVVAVSRSHEVPGGAANVAANAAGLGAGVTLVS